MTLYEEILFLKHHFKGKWVVENVKPYYEPLIKPQILERHCFWSNFEIADKKFVKDNIRKVFLDIQDSCRKNSRDPRDVAVVAVTFDRVT